MSTELLYTSAARGLRHGSRGFCTVLTTAGMPINVIARLEALSSYRHLFPPESDRAGQNPIAFSHQRVNLGGETVSVISRVAAYGTDYSGRTNKIAHHVTIEPGEMPAAGPAWLIGQPSILRQEWLGECETPGTGPVIPRGDQPPRICTTWKNLAGDAGWGGVIAEAILTGGAQPLWVIYAIEHASQTLELMDEAISLLPPANRWKATFNTFAANIPPDVECKIRFVPVGTEEARFAVADGRAIDLTKHQSITNASVWVERARGVVRNESVPAASGGSFNAVQDPVAETPMESSWSSVNESGTPPPVEPPSLPPEIGRTSDTKRQVLLASAIIGLVLLVGSTWAVARHLAGLPILPGAAPMPEVPDHQPVERPPKYVPVPKAPTTAPEIQIDLRLHFDQKQMLAWILERHEETQTPTDAVLPNPLMLRGSARIGPPLPAKAADDSDATEGSSGGSTPDAPPELPRPELTAKLIAWGGEAKALAAAEDLRVTTTKLSDGAQTVNVERFPSVPEPVQSLEVYWKRDSGDLIAIASLDPSATPPELDSLLDAYQIAGESLAKISDLVDLIQAESEKLPTSMRHLTEPFLVRALPGESSMVKSLMRSMAVGSDLSDEATKLSEALQEKQEGLPKTLSKEQQDALISVVSDCERIASVSAALKRGFRLLKAGQAIEVPELVFLDADGKVLREIPIRFHFSW